MVEMNVEENIYVFNNMCYSITDTVEVHKLLGNDPDFFAEYMEKATDAPILTSVSENTDSNSHLVDQNNFVWTTKSTKLFLQAYSERKERFRDPKIKKKQLWHEILEVLKEHGYKNIDIEILDRKMRNLKRSYKSIKENNSKSSTGRGRVSWQYYDIMEDIYANDRTINPGTTLESVICDTSEISTFPCQAQSIECDGQINNEASNTSLTADVRTSCTVPQFNISNFQTVTSLANSPSLALSASPTSRSNSDSVASGSKNKSLYNMRKKQLDLEKTRVEAIINLRESLDKSNEIQQRRNDLIEKLITSLSSQKESLANIYVNETIAEEKSTT